MGWGRVGAQGSPPNGSGWEQGVFQNSCHLSLVPPHRVPGSLHLSSPTLGCIWAEANVCTVDWRGSLEHSWK